MKDESVWPALPLAQWQDTKDTLQLYTQIVGKLRLALAPPEPQWAQVTLYVTSRGLTTSPIPYRGGAFSVDFDFIAHELIIARSDGRTQKLALGPRTVASFYDAVMSLLRSLDIDVTITPLPQEVPDTTPYAEDTKHASYDPLYVHRFWRVLLGVDIVLKRHRAPYRGRHTPVHFFWGTFDLAYTRYTGKPAVPPATANYLYRTSMDAEEIYAGFWPGDARYPAPALACYVYPKPADLEKRTLRPPAATWNAALGLFILSYDEVRVLASPETAMLEFLESSYGACSACAGWSPDLLPSA
jgi:hypothetical protein